MNLILPFFSFERIILRFIYSTVCIKNSFNFISKCYSAFCLKWIFLFTSIFFLLGIYFYLLTFRLCIWECFDQSCKHHNMVHAFISLRSILKCLVARSYGWNIYLLKKFPKHFLVTFFLCFPRFILLFIHLKEIISPPPINKQRLSFLHILINTWYGRSF